MVYNEHIETLLSFIEGDFESAWDSVAAAALTTGNRGNFMFARQAMLYLEIACRLCMADNSRAAIAEFSERLSERDPNYFRSLPRACGPKVRDFMLPSLRGEPRRELIGLLFDLVRNGQAHQYQQITVALSDGGEFFVGLSGAAPDRFLSTTFANGRPTEHLKAGVLPAGTLYLNVRTDVLWHDLKEAIRASRLLSRGLGFNYLERTYELSTRELRDALGVS